MRTASAQYLFPTGANFGADNLVLHATGRRHSVKNFPGPLSIKSVVRGEVAWVVDGRPLVVDAGSFLVLGDGQRYSIDMDVPKPVETCCVFFQRGFVETAAHDAMTPLAWSLDAPGREAPPLEFLARLHTDSTASVLPYLWSLADRTSEQIQPSGFEEEFLILAGRLMNLYREITAQIARLPAVKASTREELFRRVQRAREYIHENSSHQVSLEDVARAASLSRYHLHRSFARVFRQTPHAYLTALRLNRGRSLLQDGCSVTEVCMKIGFTSVSSFSRLFRVRFGVAPSSLRKIRKIR